MDETLNKSLKLLSEATPKARKPKRSLLRESFLVNESNLFAENRNLNNDISKMDLEFSETINFLFNPNAKNITTNIQQDGLLENKRKSDSYLDKLFIDFFEIIHTHKSSPQIFQTIADFIQTCSDSFNMIIDLESKSFGKSKESIAKENIWLENERNLWRLIYCLYQDRLTTEKNPEIELIPKNILTEKQCIENLYKSDSLLRECQLVVDWLELNAADQMWSKARIGHFTDKTIGWENTYHEITSYDRSVVYPASKPIVESLDPDAPLREAKSVHDLDVEDDKRLFKELFYHVRCGKLNDIHQLCIHCGHPWIAACLEGWRLFHDPNFNGAISSEPDSCVGNKNRILWKSNAWELSLLIDELDPYWRATLGILSGNIQPVLDVCKTWDDYLWAYLRCMIDIRVETEIRDKCVENNYEMADKYWEHRYSLNDIFNNLVKLQLTRDHSMYTFLIMDQPDQLISTMKDWLVQDCTDTSSSPPKKTKYSTQFVRLLAHIILVFRDLGIVQHEVNKNDDEIILEKYVEVLIETEQNDLIAFYTSTLSYEKQINIYSKFLENIVDNTQRLALLVNAEKCGLDIEKITRTIVENIRTKDQFVSTTDLTNETTTNDEMKISALDWLTFYESQRLEAIVQSNALIRVFLASNKLKAARQAFNKIPFDSVDLILSSYDETNIPARIQNTIKEFLCYKAYLDANECYTDWLHNFNHGKPKPPPAIQLETATFTDRVAYEHRVSQYNAEMERWRLTMESRTVNTKSVLYNVLLFPEGGWLTFTDEDDDFNEDMDDEENEIDSCRAVQLNELQSICIPKITLLLHNLLHSIGDYKQCVQLADLISDENKKLYKVFNKNAMCEFLKKISESSLALMEEKKDSWGYNFA